MRHPNLQHAAETQIRAHVCSKCPRRPCEFRDDTAAIAWRCQRACPIFQMLPNLVERAELLDPMLCSREQVLQRELKDAGRAEPSRIRATLLKRNAADVAHIVGDLVEDT